VVVLDRAERRALGRKGTALDSHLPADRFAQEARALVAAGAISVHDLARSIGVEPQWLRRVMTGEVTRLTLSRVIGICRRLCLMPEDIWDSGAVAAAFAGFPSDTFDTDDG